MKYKVGDVVTIRQWEAMERDFGVNECGNICMPGTFVISMKFLCGTKQKIEWVEGNKYRIAGYIFTDQMIEHNFHYGEEIEVSLNGVKWRKRIFLGYIDGAVEPYVCVDSEYETRFKNKEKVGICNWEHARKLSTQKIKLVVELDKKTIIDQEIDKDKWEKIKELFN